MQKAGERRRGSEVIERRRRRKERVINVGKRKKRPEM